MNCKDGVLLGFLVKVLVLFGFCGAFGGCAGSTSAGGRVRVRSGLLNTFFILSFGAFGGRVGSQCRVGWVRSGPRGDL